MSMAIHRTSERFHTVAEGVESWHCFSAGAHYDPNNIAFGPLLGFDEHLVAPGGGFARHPHRGIVIVSWVLAGALRHEDGTGRVELVQPGLAQVQHTGSGIEHSETNASDTEPLRFLQMTLVADVAEPSYTLGPPPVSLAGARLSVHGSGSLELSDQAHLFVVHGDYELAGTRLGERDSARVDEVATVTGAGELLIWTLPEPVDA